MPYFSPSFGDNDGNPNNANNWFVDAGPDSPYGTTPLAGDTLIFLERPTVAFDSPFSNTFNGLDTSAVDDNITIDFSFSNSTVFTGTLTLGHAGRTHAFGAKWIGVAATLRGAMDFTTLALNAVDTFGGPSAYINWDCDAMGTWRANGDNVFYLANTVSLLVGDGANFSPQNPLDFGGVAAISVGDGATFMPGYGAVCGNSLDFSMGDQSAPNSFNWFDPCQFSGSGGLIRWGANATLNLYELTGSAWTLTLRPQSTSAIRVDQPGTVVPSGCTIVTDLSEISGGSSVADSDVRFGVANGGGTGTLHVPATNKVLSGELVDATSGTLTLPAVGVVVSGTSYGVGGNGSTGTYVVVTTNNVRAGTTFGASSASTGTLAVPSAANVLSGVSVDAGTGTYVTVATGNVKSGITYGASSALTGTCAVPTASQVLTGVAVNATVGNVVLPSAGNVALNVTYGPSSGTTGTLVVPSSGDVRLGVGSGTLVVPSASDVRHGTSVDATTGTAYIPTAAQVLSGIHVDATVGTVVLPATTDVRSGVHFGPGSASTGTYTAGANAPGDDGILTGTVYLNGNASLGGTMALAIGNDNELTWDSLQLDGADVSDAEITAVLTTLHGGEVEGGGPISLLLVSGTTSKYRGSFPNTLTLVEGGRYRITITGVRGEANGNRVIELVASYRS